MDLQYLVTVALLTCCLVCIAGVQTRQRSGRRCCIQPVTKVSGKLSVMALQGRFKQMTTATCRCPMSSKFASGCRVPKPQTQVSCFENPKPGSQPCNIGMPSVLWHCHSDLPSAAVSAGFL